MSYDTYRPEWDPFFSETNLTPKKSGSFWGDRSTNPKSDRKFGISSALPADKNLNEVQEKKHE